MTAWRDPAPVTHRLSEMLSFRMLAIAYGYEDAGDCDSLRENMPPCIEAARIIAAARDKMVNAGSITSSPGPISREAAGQRRQRWNDFPVRPYVRCSAKA